MAVNVSTKPGIDVSLSLQGGDLITSITQDCVPIAEMAKEMQRSGQHGSSEMRLAAKLPDVFVEAYLIRNNLTLNEFVRDKSHIRAMCNDPALSVFRVWPGRL